MKTHTHAMKDRANAATLEAHYAQELAKLSISHGTSKMVTFNNGINAKRATLHPDHIDSIFAAMLDKTPQGMVAGIRLTDTRHDIFVPLNNPSPKGYINLARAYEHVHADGRITTAENHHHDHATVPHERGGYPYTLDVQRAADSAAYNVLAEQAQQGMAIFRQQEEQAKQAQQKQQAATERELARRRLGISSSEKSR